MDDSLKDVRLQLGTRLADLRARAERLSPLDVHQRMDAIRDLAAHHGLAAMEGLARFSAQHALLPGHRVATLACLEHADEALDSHSPADTQAILAALAVRLH